MGTTTATAIKMAGMRTDVRTFSVSLIARSAVVEIDRNCRTVSTGVQTTYALERSTYLQLRHVQCDHLCSREQRGRQSTHGKHVRGERGKYFVYLSSIRLVLYSC